MNSFIKSKSSIKNCLFFCTIIGISLAFLSCTEESDNPQSSSNDLLIMDGPELVRLSSGIIVEKKGDSYLLCGDIVLSTEQFHELNEKGSITIEAFDDVIPLTNVCPITNLPLKGKRDTRGVGVYSATQLWAMMRFTYDSSLSDTQKQYIREALLDIQSKTNVRFYNATGLPTHDYQYNIDYPYVNFVNIGEVGNSNSQIGRVGGRQDLNLNFWDFFSRSTIEHEICHALGMFHEQSRYDRDNYVTVNTSNLTTLGLQQFQKITSNYYIKGSYDFYSIMGYNSYTSDTNMVYNTGVNMYLKNDGGSISQGYNLSTFDRQWLNDSYLPFIARSDNYLELDSIVYKSDNTIMTEQERLQLQAQLNNGNPNPPANGHIPNNF